MSVPPEHMIFVLPAAADAIFKNCVCIDAFGAVGTFNFTKSAPRDTATPAAPAIKCGLSSWHIALPRGYIQRIVTNPC